MNGEQQVHNLLEIIESTPAARPLIVVFLNPINNDLAESVLSRASVSGVVLSGPTEFRILTGDPHIGFCHGANAGAWSLSQGGSPTIVIFGVVANIGLRVIREAIHRRVRRFVFVEPPLDIIRSYGFCGLATRYICGRIGHKIGAAKILAYPAPFLGRFISYIIRRGKLLLLAHQVPHALHRARRSTAGVAPSGGSIILAIGTLGPGGSERQAVNTALALSADGQFRPIVACLDLSDETSVFYKTTLEQAGIEVVNLSAHAPVNLNSEDLTLFQANWKELGSFPSGLATDVALFQIFFLQKKPSIVHAFLDDTNVKAGIAAVLSNVPRIILSTRSVAPDNFALHQSYMRPAYRALMALPDVHLWNNSHAGATDYRRWLGKRTPRIEVVQNGIDFAEFGVRSGVDLKLRAVWDVPSNALILGSIMRLSEEKQPVLWARVVVEISRRLPDVHFVLCGDGPLRAEVGRIVAQARIQSRVHILGQVQDPAAVLRALDVFLLTSRLEGLPNVLIEAQAVGVPVITTPAGGASETLDPGHTGLVSRDQTVRSVADTCIELLTDNELRKQCAEAAPKFVRGRFSRETMIANTLRLYKS